MELKQIIRCPYCDAEEIYIFSEEEQKEPGSSRVICTLSELNEGCYKAFLLKWKIDIDYSGYKIYTETQGLKNSSVKSTHIPSAKEVL